MTRRSDRTRRARTAKATIQVLTADGWVTVAGVADVTFHRAEPVPQFVQRARASSLGVTWLEPRRPKEPR